MQRVRSVVKSTERKVLYRVRQDSIRLATPRGKIRGSRCKASTGKSNARVMEESMVVVVVVEEEEEDGDECEREEERL